MHSSTDDPEDDPWAGWAQVSLEKNAAHLVSGKSRIQLNILAIIKYRGRHWVKYSTSPSSLCVMFCLSNSVMCIVASLRDREEKNEAELLILMMAFLFSRYSSLKNTICQSKNRLARKIFWQSHFPGNERNHQRGGMIFQCARNTHPSPIWKWGQNQTVCNCTRTLWSCHHTLTIVV